MARLLSFIKMLALRGAFILLGVIIALGLIEATLRTLSLFAHRQVEARASALSGLGRNEWRILCVGESTTHGLGTDAWPAQLERILQKKFPDKRIKVVNYGIPAILTGEVLARLPGWLRDIRPNIVITMLGINDADNVLMLKPVGKRALFSLDNVASYSRAVRLFLTLARSSSQTADPEPPGDPLLEKYARALKLRQKEEWQNLRSLLQEIYAETGDPEDAFRLADLLYSRLKETGEALNVLKRSLEKNGDHIQSLMLAGQILLKLQMPDEAIKYFNRITELQPEQLTAWTLEVETLIGQGKLDQALQRVTDSEALGGYFELYKVKARALLAKGDRTAAFALLENNLTASNDPASSRVTLYNFLLEQGEEERAQEVLRSLRRDVVGNATVEAKYIEQLIKDNNAEGVLEVVSHDYQSMWQEASQCPACSSESLALRVAIKRYPQIASGLQDLRTHSPGRFRELTSDNTELAESVELYRSRLLYPLFQSNELSAAGMRELKRLLMHLNEYQKAATIIEKLVAVHPDPEDYLDVDHLLYGVSGRALTQEERLVYNRRSAEDFPDSCLFTMRYMRVISLDSQIDQDERDRRFEEAYSRCREFNEILETYTNTLINEKRFDQALSFLNKIKSTDLRGFPRIYEALVREKMNDYEGALRSLKEATHFFPGYSAAMGRLADYYKHFGPAHERSEVQRKIIDSYGYSFFSLIELGRSLFAEGKYKESMLEMMRWADLLDVDQSCSNCEAADIVTSNLLKYVDESRRKAFLEAIGAGEMRQNFQYNPKTAENYQKIADIIHNSGARQIAMQYPLIDPEPLVKLLSGREGVTYVSNYENFSGALETHSYDQIFTDRIGRVFGHLTDYGNEIIATNLADLFASQIAAANDERTSTND